MVCIDSVEGLSSLDSFGRYTTPKSRRVQDSAMTDDVTMASKLWENEDIALSPLAPSKLVDELGATSPAVLSMMRCVFQIAHIRAIR